MEAQRVTAKNDGYGNQDGYNDRYGKPRPDGGGGGLYLLVTPSGAKQWRLRYTLSGRESMVSLGTYPATSLKAARAKRTGMHAALESGRDPAAKQRAERAS
jgi:hypothetical protein